MNRGSLRYEGKAKRVYETEDPTLYIMEYKDDATAFNGEKKGTIEGKGVVNNHMSNVLMRLLADMGVPNHFVSELSEREVLVRAVEIVPLEVIVRNVAAGSFAARYGVAEGTEFSEPTVEFSYKKRRAGRPADQLPRTRASAWRERVGDRADQRFALKIDEILVKFWKERGCASSTSRWSSGAPTARCDPRRRDKPRHVPVDVGCRNRDHLDKDRFRRDLGDVQEGYAEALRRLEIAVSD